VIYIVFIASVFSQVSVLESRYDPGRTGANLQENLLTTTKISPSTFGKVYSYSVDGQIYAQPLYVPNVAIPGKGTHNILVVATMNDMLYAFDADQSSPPLWSVNFAASPNSPEFSFDILGRLGLNITDSVGIESTPIIDPATNSLYIVARTRENQQSVFRLHSLDLATGAEKFGSPVQISGVFTSGGKNLAFNPEIHNQRAGLALANNDIIVAFGSHEDQLPYYGWVMAYNKATTLQQTGVFVTVPTADHGGAIWQSGRAPAVDSSGYVYLFIGNAWGGNAYNGFDNFSESVIKLDPSSGLTPVDWFTPSNWQFLDVNDQDVSGSGPMLIPGTNLLLGGGKEGVLYLLNKNNLGQYNLTDNQVLQKLSTNGEIRGGPVFWPRTASDSLMYNFSADSTLQAFSFNGATFQVTQTSPPLVAANPGGILTLSANGDLSGSGVLWSLMPASNQYDAERMSVPGLLRAFDAENIAHELWNSLDFPGDDFGLLAKFVPPVVANGKVYVATFSNQVAVYGLLKTSNQRVNISGTITSASAPLEGVSFTASGASCTISSANGIYTCTVAQSWTGTVTPSLNGYAFTPASINYATPAQGNQPGQDYSAVSTILPSATVWVDDMVPTGATVGGDKESWHWIISDPLPVLGAMAHESPPASGEHQHYFLNATNTLTPDTGDSLFAYVYMDPVNPPSEIMLQWYDGSTWNHRAYWGVNNIDFGSDGTVSRHYMGPLPYTGSWELLEVPASAVGLENTTVNGMAFTLYGGLATWDLVGKIGGSTSPPPPPTSTNYSISGTVTSAGTPLGNVSFTASGASCTSSNANGAYTCTVPKSWTGTVTPSLNGYTFTPASTNYTTPVQGNQSGQNYSAASTLTSTYNISGTITSAGAPLGDVSFAEPGASCTKSNASGGYTCIVPQAWTGTVTPSLNGYNFTPVSTNYTTPVQGNQGSQNYSATSTDLPDATVWVEDMVPTGATVAGDQESWNWILNNPLPVSGAMASQSALASGEHQHYFMNAANTMTPGTGDTLFAYVYLDPTNPPSEIMLQWNDGSTWNHRAYWGANNIGFGSDGTVSRHYIGPLPSAGSWVLLQIPASAVGLENKTVNGMAFTLYDGRATWDFAGKTSTAGSAPPTTTSTYNISGTITSAGVPLGNVTFAAPGANCTNSNANGAYTCSMPQSWTGTITPSISGYTFTPASTNYTTPVQGNQGSQNYSATSTDLPGATVWVEDMVPTGATVAGDQESWNWILNNPLPVSGAMASQSALASGEHQHYFMNATNTLIPGTGDTLFAYVYLDPVNPPSEIMLQWNDGTWEHRAYWGANNIAWGSNGTVSRHYMGYLPAAGSWVLLQVPASAVGLENRTLNGMAFTLYGGLATWDFAGKL
jgi:hypothetical protein